MSNTTARLPVNPSLLPAASRSTGEVGSLEHEFRRFYVERNLLSTRIALGSGFWLLALMIGLDALLMPAAFTERVLAMRLTMMLIPLLGALGATFLLKEKIWVPPVVGSVAVVVGLSSIVVTGVAAESAVSTGIWGTTSVVLFIYLLLGLTLRQATLAASPILLFFLAYGIIRAWPAELFVYGAVFLLVTTVVGSFVSYRLERSAREIFDKRHELARLARIDGFTGLHNRRTFDEHLRQSWKQARRDDTKIAIAVVDIDHFKLYNDCYGHKKGDECIKAVADVLADSVNRPLDVVARYGGEEFVIMLYDASPSFLASFTRGVCHKVVDLDIEHKAAEATPSISVSIGAAITEPGGNLSPEQLLRQADDALYEAKSQGRNPADLAAVLI